MDGARAAGAWLARGGCLGTLEEGQGLYPGTVARAAARRRRREAEREEWGVRARALIAETNLNPLCEERLPCVVWRELWPP